MIRYFFVHVFENLEEGALCCHLGISLFVEERQPEYRQLVYGDDGAKVLIGVPLHSQKKTTSEVIRAGQA